MQKQITQIILLLAICCLPLAVSYAAVPHLINYQGRLTDSAGMPLNGSYTVTFRIYDAEAAGNLLWQGTHSVSIQKGIFNVLLGDISDTGYNFSGLTFDKEYYLEIKVGNEVMSPRQKITSSAYAIRTETAESAIEAQNANTVANVAVSTTPQANKILPLDNNGKIPQSVIGLKVYDSGWFPVAAGANYTKTHNLGTNKVLVQVFTSESPSGSNAILSDSTYTYIGLTTYNITTTSISLHAGLSGFHFTEAVIGPIYSGYARIIMLALE